MVLSLPRVPKTRLWRASGRIDRRSAKRLARAGRILTKKTERKPTMKNVIKLILSSSLLVTLAFAAKSTEEAYVESYAGRTDMPVPVAVVKPVIEPGYEGATVRLSFVIEADGSPREIFAPVDADYSLVKQLTAAVSQWKFKPLTRDGVVVRTRVVLPIRVADDSGAGTVALR